MANPPEIGPRLDQIVGSGSVAGARGARALRQDRPSFPLTLSGAKPTLGDGGGGGNSWRHSEHSRPRRVPADSAMWPSSQECYGLDTPTLLLGCQPALTATVRVLCACASPEGALRAQFGALISASSAVCALVWWGSAWFDSHPLPPTCLNSVRNELSVRASTRGAPSHAHAPTLFGKGSLSARPARQLPSTTSFCET